LTQPLAESIVTHRGPVLLWSLSDSAGDSRVFFAFSWRWSVYFLFCISALNFVVLSAFFLAALGTLGSVCLVYVVGVVFIFLFAMQQPNKQTVLMFACALSMLILGLVSCFVISYNISTPLPKL